MENNGHVYYFFVVELPYRTSPSHFLYGPLTQVDRAVFCIKACIPPFLSRSDLSIHLRHHHHFTPFIRKYLYSLLFESFIFNQSKQTTSTMFQNGFFGLFKTSQQQEETQQPTWNASTMTMEQPANYAGNQEPTSVRLMHSLLFLSVILSVLC